MKIHSDHSPYLESYCYPPASVLDQSGLSRSNPGRFKAYLLSLFGRQHTNPLSLESSPGNLEWVIVYLQRQSWTIVVH